MEARPRRGWRCASSPGGSSPAWPSAGQPWRAVFSLLRAGVASTASGRASISKPWRSTAGGGLLLPGRAGGHGARMAASSARAAGEQRAGMPSLSPSSLSSAMAGPACVCVRSVLPPQTEDGGRSAMVEFGIASPAAAIEERKSLLRFLLAAAVRMVLAACPVLQSLVLRGDIGFPRVQIVSQTLRSIGVRRSCGPINLRHLTIEDAPCLERVLCFDCFCRGITISVISAPQLLVLGPHSPKLEFGTTVFQGSGLVSLEMVMHSVKVLSLSEVRLSLDVVIGYMKCFPYLERLYIQTKMAGEKNSWCHKYRNLNSTLDIRLKKIVLAGYRGNTSHVNFAKFFVLNARMLESMSLELHGSLADPSDAWIDKQHRLLWTRNKASRYLQLDFAYSYGLRLTHSFFRPEQVHDLSTADPFP